MWSSAIHHDSKSHNAIIIQILRGKSIRETWMNKSTYARNLDCTKQGLYRTSLISTIHEHECISERTLSLSNLTLTLSELLREPTKHQICTRSNEPQRLILLNEQCVVLDSGSLATLALLLLSDESDPNMTTAAMSNLSNRQRASTW